MNSTCYMFSPRSLAADLNFAFGVLIFFFRTSLELAVVYCFFASISLQTIYEKGDPYLTHGTKNNTSLTQHNYCATRVVHPLVYVMKELLGGI